MSWVKLDDGFPDHPKVLRAGPLAAWLWACGLAYCNRQPARDGFIPTEKVRVLYPVAAPMSLARKLVEVGLWEAVDGGYRVHDYHDYQPREDLRTKRAEAGRRGGERSGEARRAQQPTKHIASITEATVKQSGSNNEAIASNPGPVPDSVPRKDLPPEGGEVASGQEAAATLRAARPDLVPLLERTRRERPATQEIDLAYFGLYRQRKQAWPDPIEMRDALDSVRSASGLPEATLVASWERFLDPEQNPDRAQFVRPKVWAANLGDWLPGTARTTARPSRDDEKMARARALIREADAAEAERERARKRA